VVKFAFSHSKPNKQPFFTENFEIQRGKPPLPLSDAHRSIISLRNTIEAISRFTLLQKHRFKTNLLIAIRKKQQQQQLKFAASSRGIDCTLHS